MKISGLDKVDKRSTLGSREREIGRILLAQNLVGAGDQPKLWKKLRYHVFELKVRKTWFSKRVHTNRPTPIRIQYGEKLFCPVPCKRCVK